MERPKLVVFDLDLTLWECGGAVWCDCLSPPFHRDQNHVLDRRGNRTRLFDDVISILDDLDQHEIPAALASRTNEPSWARELLELLGIENRFAFAQIYPEAKFSHFASLREQSGFAYDEMLFFDDEMRNIRDVSQLGVDCVHVSEGVNQPLFRHSMRAFQSR
jgi:magnesium-dependent phosphatase 1